ncbi:Magnetosome protein MamN [Candidatus Magnetaquicoccaceae bacterium FCR-1]|uniref:Magnetosome protein MamN n=1 Tax=Candidatus Magnetaquiglobus chichijimensis TaxID=3141448 RepID=A0ABQ0CAF8_9PROT
MENFRIVMMLSLFVAIFILVQTDRVERGIAMLGGAVLFLLLGWLFDFYILQEAYEAIYFDSLALLFGMSLISNVLYRSGIFHQLAFKAVGYSQGNRLLILTLLILSTYSASLCFNNLSVMVIVLPLTLVLCQSLDMPAAPLVAAELIASNLGGASTLVGDFPNMIIGSVARLHFDDFIAGMMVPCLGLLALLLLKFQKHAEGPASVRLDMDAIHTSLAQLSPNHAGSGRIDVDRQLFKVGGWAFVLSLIGFFLAKPLGILPAMISLLAGVGMLLWGRIPRRDLFDAMSGGDLLFFLGLFVMVGGLQAAGVLELFRVVIETLGGGQSTTTLVAVMWLAGVVTPLFNAGPSTALLIPVVKSMSGEMPGDAIWWALSLGVLAGSSATLSGATAGPVVASTMARYAREMPEDHPLTGKLLDFYGYLQWGIPIALLFLMCSTLYITAIAP